MDRKALVKQVKVWGVGCIQDADDHLFRLSEKSVFFKGMYSLMKRLLKVLPVTPYQITDHLHFAETHGTSSHTVLITNRVGYTSKLVFGNSESTFDLVPKPLPDVYLSKHRNVRIQGNSDFVLVPSEQLVINDFGFDMDPKYANVDGALLAQKGNRALMRYDDKRVNRKLEACIMLSAKFSQNYYHQMYEILVKLVLLDRAEVPADVPVLVDEVVMKVPSFKQLFDCLNRTLRPILTIGPKEIVEVDTLYCLSAVNLIPPFKVNFEDDGLDDIFFDWKLTLEMRDRLLEHRSQRSFPKRIFLSRKSSNNRQYNEADVMALVQGYDFTVVCPEEYDLYDQMALFGGAECIVGASGAAFSNLLFCSPGCKILCFVSRELNIPAFTTIAYNLGCPMRYCLGTPHSKDLQAGYTVDLTMLETMLDNWMKP